jgi:hypothetical protein
MSLAKGFRNHSCSTDLSSPYISMSNGSEWHKLDLLSQRAVGEGGKKEIRGFIKTCKRDPCGQMLVIIVHKEELGINCGTQE